MSLYVSNGDVEDCNNVKDALRRMKHGAGAKRIPRKTKKRLAGEWRFWRARLRRPIPAAAYDKMRALIALQAEIDALRDAVSGHHR